MEQLFKATLESDGFGVRVVAKGDTSVTDWLGAFNSSLDVTIDVKVPGTGWREVMSEGVGLAYEKFWEIAGTGVGCKISEIEQTGGKSGRVTLKLKSKVAGKKSTLEEEKVNFSF